MAIYTLIKTWTRKNGATEIENLGEYPSNPLDPIMEVWEKYKDVDIGLNGIGSICRERDQLWDAIKKCIKIMGGK